MNYTRMIKLHIPSNEYVNITIPENETELKELLSKISNISSSRIKGIKDSKGNYFTLSALTKNINLFKVNDDIYYELVFRNGTHSLYEKKYHRINTENFTSSDFIIQNYFNKKSKFHKKTFSMNELSQIEIQKFSSFLLQYLSNKQIDENKFFELNKMMKEQNKELITQFKFFLNGKISNEKFIILLNLFYDNRIKKQIFIPNKKLNKKDSVNEKEVIIEKMKYFFSKEDYEILKELIDNENIKISLNKYELDGNLIELITIFQEEISKYKLIIKPKKSESFTNLNEKLKLHKKSSEKKDIKRHNSLPDNVIRENEKIKNNNKIESLNVDKKIKKEEKIFNKIKKHLNEPFKILLNYFYNNNNNEYKRIMEVYTENKKMKIKTNKPLKEHCMKFIDKEITNYSIKKNNNFSEKKFKVLHNLFDNNDPIILNAFQEFSNNNSLKSLIKELINITKKKKKSLKKNEENKIEDNKTIENEDLLINDFIENLQKIKLTNEEKEKIKELINQKNEEINIIISEYKNNNSNINIIEDKLRKILINNLKKNKNSKELNIQNSYKEYTENFKKLIINFKQEEIAFLEEQFSKKNSIILSIYDVYLKDLDINEFNESLNIFLKKEFKNYHSPSNKKKINNQDNSKTPEALKASKDKLYLLMNANVLKSQNVIVKQKEIISLLFQENCIDEKVYNIIDKKINEDDAGLISAFEVYAVTKDHHEFIETLNIIGLLTENYKILFYSLINKSKFNHSEKDNLIQLFNSKNKKIFNILKLFDENKDRSLAIDSMKKLIE